MALSMEEQLRFEEIITAAEYQPSLLNDWERNFIQSQMENHKKYGANTRLSAKQWAILDGIAVKLAI